MKTIDFTEEELNVLAQLIDIAVKSQGMGVAEAAVVLINKIRIAVDPEKSIDGNPQFANSDGLSEEAEVVEK